MSNDNVCVVWIVPRNFSCGVMIHIHQHLLQYVLHSVQFPTQNLILKPFRLFGQNPFIFKVQRDVKVWQYLHVVLWMIISMNRDFTIEIKITRRFYVMNSYTFNVISFHLLEPPCNFLAKSLGRTIHIDVSCLELISVKLADVR